MDTTSKRLAVAIPPVTAERLRQEAQRRRVSIDELVCEAVDLLLASDREARLQAARALCRVEAPVTDWPQMKREIEDARAKPSA
jgi:hypothetical protein